MKQFGSDVEAAESLKQHFGQLRAEISKVIIGQDEVVHQLLISIFCNGHSLLVGVPGLAKTLLIKTLASVLDLSFSRIQFTPDLMPSDIIGSEMLDQDRKFRFNKGPVFAHIVLADEINRTPPKTQAALLEAMQEKAVTVGGQSYDLPKPFFVLATQNPIEQEGTYPLPEAQLDRFMFNITLTYPSLTQEIAIVKGTTTDSEVALNQIMSQSDIEAYQHLVRRVPVADNVVEYAVKLIHRCRPGSELATATTRDFVEWGAGPRASQFLILAAKCHALFQGKYSPDIEDVQQVALPVLRHRLVRNFKAEAEGLGIEEIVGKNW
ncbi:MAG: AAA domain-containing protein [Cytophagales bacterium]|nr:AAA domain-containing protein [Cytophagales bacterium]